MHIAFITSIAPPLNHVSTKRIYYFSHHLALLGHKTSLISADLRSLNKSLLLEVDETQISNFIRIDPRDWFPGFENQVNSFTLEPPSTNRFKSKISTFFRLIEGWGPWSNFGKRALSELLELHKKEKIDVVFAVFGDETSHEIAHRFSKQTKVPWIADFKDPWDLSVTGMARQLRLLHTKKRLKTCRCITETSEIQARADEARFKRPCHIIPSGFDLDMINKAKAIVSQQSGKLNLFYFGTMGGMHDWKKLIKLFHLIDRSELKGKVVLNWYGFISQPITNEIKSQQLDSYFKLNPQVRPSEAFSLMKGSELLLLVPMYKKEGHGAGIGVKELEYVAAARPIFCLGKIHEQIKSVTEPNLIHEFLDIEPALEFLIDFYKNPQKYELNIQATNGNPRPIHQYSWHHMAQKLSELISQLTSNSTERSSF